jgi:hypothetical protein
MPQTFNQRDAFLINKTCPQSKNKKRKILSTAALIREDAYNRRVRNAELRFKSRPIHFYPYALLFEAPETLEVILYLRKRDLQNTQTKVTAEGQDFAKTQTSP